MPLCNRLQYSFPVIIRCGDGMGNLVGGIDAGGTTFKCGVKNEAGEWVAKHRVPVTDPQTTIDACISFFQEAVGDHQLSGFGIASFGPIDVDRHSPSYGTILTTPKPGWSNTPLRAMFADRLGVKVAINTDVNGALLAEMGNGAAKNSISAVYITVGTGIGAGIAINGQLVGRPSHPEFGHTRVKRHPNDADFEGICPFHGDCLEGLASVTALKRRWGDPVEWEEDHVGWDVAAYYLAQGVTNLMLTLRLDRIILGGGLMLAPTMLIRVREQVDDLIAGYIDVDESYIINTPFHGDDAGLEGALCLAQGL